MLMRKREEERKGDLTGERRRRAAVCRRVRARRWRPVARRRARVLAAAASSVSLALCVLRKKEARKRERMRRGRKVCLLPPIYERPEEIVGVRFPAHDPCNG